MTMHDDLAERVYALEAKDEIRRLMASYGHASELAPVPYPADIRAGRTLSGGPMPPGRGAPI